MREKRKQVGNLTSIAWKPHRGYPSRPQRPAQPPSSPSLSGYRGKSALRKMNKGSKYNTGVQRRGETPTAPNRRTLAHEPYCGGQKFLRNNTHVRLGPRTNHFFHTAVCERQAEGAKGWEILETEAWPRITWNPRRRQVSRARQTERHTQKRFNCGRPLLLLTSTAETTYIHTSLRLHVWSRA